MCNKGGNPRSMVQTTHKVFITCRTLLNMFYPSNNQVIIKNVRILSVRIIILFNVLVCSVVDHNLYNIKYEQRFRFWWLNLLVENNLLSLNGTAERGRVKT